MSHGDVYVVLIVVYAIAQIAYLMVLGVNTFFYTRPVDWIDVADAPPIGPASPPVLLLYPVLHEAEETMRTTMLTIAAAQEAYAPGVARVLAIPNADDHGTRGSLERLAQEFSFLEILAIPPTSDPSWAPVWSNWDTNTKAYWWHIGKRAGSSELPPKKTRQMIYALYTFAAELPGDNWLLSYLDADSAVPPDYYQIAAAGIQTYDVVQLTNVAGNLMDTWATSFHGLDHMAWDGSMYPHMTANGRHPFYVLGKGVFYKVNDLLELGGFHPWLTIEDPEVGMRLWANGRRLGVSPSPLIEEVPGTFRGGITQRKRWVAGFFQSLHTPLTLMGMSFRQRMRARLNLVPCLGLLISAVGIPIGVWALVEACLGRRPVDPGLFVLSVVNLVGAALILANLYTVAWTRSALVLDNRRSRLTYMLRINPLFLIMYWLLWTVPLVIGTTMFMRDRGLVWQRTEKNDANHELVRTSPSIDLTDDSRSGPSTIDLTDGARSKTTSER
jgi:hypothetical protein